MRLRFKKAWKYSPNGYDVVECAAASESDVPDDLAAIAVDEGFAEKVKAPATRGSAPRAKDEDKKPGAKPDDKKPGAGE